MARRTSVTALLGVLLMAVVTTITARTTVGSQSYDIGGRPVALVLWSNGQSGTPLAEGFRFLQGMADADSQVCRSVATEDNAASPNGCQVECQDRIYQMAALVASGTAAITQEAELVEFTDTGFTLDWTVVDGVASRICVFAILVGEVTNAKLIHRLCDTDPEVVTGVGFAADAIITLGGTTADLSSYAAGPFAALPLFGVSDGVGNYSADFRGRLTGSTLPACSNTTGASSQIRYISGIFEGFVAVGVVISNVTSDGFDVGIGGFGPASLYHHFLCLAGIDVKVGVVTQPASGGDQTSLGLTFDPSVVLLFGGGATNTDMQIAQPSIGAWRAGGVSVTHAHSAIENPNPSETASENDQSTALRMVTPAATAGSSTVVAAVSVNADGQALTWDVSDGAQRKVYYIALGLLPPPSCSGGAVPQVVDPPGGVEFTGLGPHGDRFFTEVDLDDGMVSLALHDPIGASPALVAHGGRKTGSMTQVGSIIRRSTDRLGGWQSSTSRWSTDDHDRYFRAAQKAQRWYGREFRHYLGDRLDLANSRCLGRFNIREYPPQPGFGVDVEGTDVIGSEFSAFNLDRDILDSYVFDGDRFPNAPAALLELETPQPVPAYWGRWSDEGSGGSPPVLAGTTARGSWPPATIGSLFRVGFGEMALVNPGGVSPPAPDTASGVSMAGGNIDLGLTPYNRVFAQVWAVTGGVEGDPMPFYPELLPITITANNQKVRVSWTFGGSDPDNWRIGLATDFFGARWGQVLEVAGSARQCDFTDHAYGGNGTSTPTATAPYWNRKEFAVAANMPDGKTGVCAIFGQHPYAGPYQRPAYVSWIPIPGAVSYDLYFAQVPYQYFGWKRRVVVGADQIDADGYVYYTYNWGADGEEVDGFEQPRGMLPVWDTGDVAFDGGTYGQLVIGRYPMHLILGVYAGEARVSDSHPDVRHPDHPSWPGPDRFIAIDGWDTTILYVRVGSSLLTEHRDGTAIIRVNACATEDIGDGYGSTITQAGRVVQHVVTELVFNDHQSGTWAGIPLYADGVPIVRSSAFLAAETMQVARVGGTGYTARIALVEPTTLRTLIQNIVQSFGLHLGINQHGQVVCGHYDDSVDTTVGYPHYKDIREIVGNIRVEPRTRELENRIPHQWDYRPETRAYNVINQVAVNETSIADYLGKPRTGQLRSLPYAADQLTVDDVMQRLLLLGAYVREWAEVPVSIVGFDNDVDLFKIIAVTDEEGTGLTGYQEEFILVLEIEVIPPDPAQDRPVIIVLKGLNITPLADAAWVWGPDSITTWDTMTADEKGTYGAWATDGDVIPSANDPAKEWR